MTKTKIVSKTKTYSDTHIDSDTSSLILILILTFMLTSTPALIWLKSPRRLGPPRHFARRRFLFLVSTAGCGSRTDMVPGSSACELLAHVMEVAGHRGLSQDDTGSPSLSTTWTWAGTARACLLRASAGPRQRCLPASRSSTRPSRPGSPRPSSASLSAL